jgi:hypothetical protein
LIGKSKAVIKNKAPIKNKDDGLVQLMRHLQGQNAILYVRNPDRARGTNFKKLKSIMMPDESRNYL